MASVVVKPEPVVQSGNKFLSKDFLLAWLAPVVLLLIATIAVYAPVHDHPFANLDDPKYVTQNQHIANGLTGSTVFWAFTHGYSGNWHPLTWMSHALDIQLFGLDPAPQHDENVLLHALNVILLFWVLKRATGYTGRSLMVAALFAVHPLNVESVAWIAERKTMLSSLFCLLALGAYHWYAQKPGILRYAVMTGLFVLGLFSKPQIIMLPLVLLLWDFWPLKRMILAGEPAQQTTAAGLPMKRWWWLIKEKFPLFFICIVDAGVTMIAQHMTGSSQPWTIWVRLENALVSYTRYIRKAFWPTNLALYYPHPGRSLQWWQVVSAIAVLAAITAFAWQKRQQYRYLIVGWLWFLIMLIPMIGLVQADVQGMADRYAYLSFIGLFIMACWGVADWAAQQHLPRFALPAAGVAAVVAFSLVSHHQLNYWSSDVALWSHSAEVTTNNWKAELMLGAALDVEGRREAALQHYFRAAAVEPNDPFINQNIAYHEFTNHNLPLALEYYRKTVASAWNAEQGTAALQSMAVVYRQMGEPEKANECLAKSHALPQRAIDWQGAWWQQIIPQLKRWLHGGSLEGYR